jgi:methionine-rich copper-binding protein CopC
MFQRLLIPLLALLLLPAAAAGHASLRTAAPAANATLQTSPTSLRLVFSERVTGSGDALVAVGADGVRVSGSTTITGGVLTAPLSALAPGRYAYTYIVESLDGHVITGSLAFAVRTRTRAATRATVVLTDRRVRLSGARVGQRTLRLWAGVREGTVRWTSPLVAAPFVWTIRHGKASGLLPFAGDYTLEVRARTSLFHETIAIGTTTIQP